jgi:hypothetical protein
MMNDNPYQSASQPQAMEWVGYSGGQGYNAYSQYSAPPQAAPTYGNYTTFDDEPPLLEGEERGPMKEEGNAFGGNGPSLPEG